MAATRTSLFLSESHHTYPHAYTHVSGESRARWKASERARKASHGGCDVRSCCQSSKCIATRKESTKKTLTAHRLLYARLYVWKPQKTNQWVFTHTHTHRAGSTRATRQTAVDRKSEEDEDANTPHTQTRIHTRTRHKNSRQVPCVRVEKMGRTPLPLLPQQCPFSLALSPLLHFLLLLLLGGYHAADTLCARRVREEDARR